MKSHKRKFIVELEMPQGASVTAVKEYIQHAVICERGHKDPLDPMFELDTDTIKVTSFLEKK